MPSQLFEPTIAGTAMEAVAFITNILESSTEYSIIGKDLDGNIVLWNEGARRIYGYEAAEVVGKANASLLHAPEDVAAGKPREILEIALREGKWEGTLSRVRKNGELFTARTTVTPRRDALGQPVGFLLISKDTSLEVRLADERRQSEERLTGIVNSAMDAIVTVDDAQRITLFNPAAERMFGYTAAAVLGQSVECLIPERFRAAHGAHIRHFAQTGMTSRKMGALGALSGLRANGDEFPLEASISQLEISGQKLFSVILRDTSERHKTEEELRAVLTNARCILWRAEVRDAKFETRASDDFEGGLRWRTRIQDEYAAQQVLPLEPRDDLKYEALLANSRHPEDRLRINEAARRAILQGWTSYTQEFRCIDKFGRTVWLHEEATIVPTGAGQWEIYGVATDITKRKLAEEATRESEELFSKVFRLSPDCVVVVRLSDRTIVRANEAICHLWGSTPDEIIGKPTQEYTSWLNEEERLAFLKELEEKGEYLDYETLLRLKDGRQIPFNISCRMITLGGEACVLSVMRDLSERKQSETQMREVMTNARCMLWSGEVKGLPGWDDEKRRWTRSFSWHIAIHAEEAAQQVLPLDLQPGQPYERAFSHARLPEDMARCDLNGMEAFVSGASHFAQEFRCRDRHGNLHWLHEDIVIDPAEYGRWKVFGVVTDITERKRAEEDIHELQRFLQSTVDALSTHIAVLDETGTIIAVNVAWCKFAEDNSALYSKIGLGVNYLEICDTAAGPHGTEALRAATGIRAVMEGECAQFALEYPCHSSEEQRWFLLRATRFPGQGARRIVIAHENITDRKLAEIALRDGEERLRIVTENARVGLVLVNSERRYTFANAAYIEMLGLPSPDIVGRRVADVLAPLYENQIRPHLDRAFAGARVAYELHKPTLIGDRHYAVRYEPTTVDDSLSVVVVITDITERKQAEQELQRSEARLRLFIEHAPAALAMFDHEMRYLNVSRRWLSDYGLEGRDLIGLSHYEVFPEVPQQWKDIHQRALAGEVLRADEDCFERADGSTQWLKWEVRPWRGVDEEIAGVLIFSEDITNSKAAEAALHDSEERFRQMAETINEVFWMTDPATSQMLYINSAYEQIWGRSRQSLRDEPQSFIEAIHVEDRERFIALLEDKTNQGGFDTEYRIVRPDGEVRWIWDRGYPIRDESGAIYRVAGIAQDITERKAAEVALKTIHEELEMRVEMRTSELAQAIEELQAANDEAESARSEAERANHSKSEFLSRMSHELRTPLNAIIGFGQILEMRSELNTKDGEAVEQILRGGQHLLGLINEVLDIARIEAGHLSISPEPIPVAQAIRDVLGIVRPLATPRDIAIVNALPASDERHVLADRQRFHQILLNLLSNAIKYNRDGGQVTISCGENEGFLRLSVRDTGAGLTSAELRKLFIPFERLGAAKTQIEGTGIGLALCKRLVEAMEGRIGVESKPGQGCVFWIEFALVESPSESLQQSEEAWLYGNAETGGQSVAQHTILYIEDNLSNLRLIENILDDRSEIKLISAMQGGIGLDLARQHRPDLILLDLHLPDMLGDEVLRRLQAEPSTRAIPVVMLSADATPGQIERLLGAGAKAYLTKPLNLRQFLQTLEETFNEKHD